MKNNKILVALVISLAILNFISLGFIWFTHINRPYQNLKHRNINRTELILKKEIGLSEQQLNLFKKARSEHFEKIRPIERSLREEKKRLFAANMRKEDIKTINPILKRIGALQIKRDSLTYLHFAEMRSYCQESQLEEFDKMLGKMLRREFGRHSKNNGGASHRKIK